MKNVIKPECTKALKKYWEDTRLGRFWSKVDVRGEDECWPWKAYATPTGYGLMSFKGHPTGAHRVAYMIAHGSIDKNLHCCHYCDNRLCCNPAHLFLGTDQDNQMDKTYKGRSFKKLNREKVIEIRLKASKGEPPAVLANEFGVSDTHIRRIINGQSSGHINSSSHMNPMY